MSFYLIILIIGVVGSFYMAWTIGANDLANAMGPSVGGGGLSIKGAVIVGGVLTIVGSILVGEHVSTTIGKGIVQFPETTTVQTNIIIIAMVAALLGAAVWGTIATYFAMPISTSHSIIGALIGIGFVVGGSTTNWGMVGLIASSWVISPLSGAAIAFLLFMMVKRSILDANDPIKRSKLITPILIMGMVFFILFSFMYGGPAMLGLDTLSLWFVLILSTAISVGALILSYYILSRYEFEGEDDYAKVERLFVFMLIISSAYLAYSQGAHNVANAAGPLLVVTEKALPEIIEGGFQSPSLIFGILLFGGVAMAIGSLTWGYKVIQTIGNSITQLTPTRAFSALFAAASIQLVFSRLGIPTSSSHICVGGVIGVGLAGGLAAVDTKVVRRIVLYLLLTLPAAAGITVGIFFGLKLFI